MKHKIKFIIFCFITTSIICCDAPVFATQSHSDPEGLYVHQMSHLFFFFSMGSLIYWLRKRNLVQKTGWKYIQYSSFFFILWTLDAFTAHLLDEQYELIKVKNIEVLTLQIDSSYYFLEIFYYFVKLDHLLCVPAMILLYTGIKQLAKETHSRKSN